MSAGFSSLQREKGEKAVDWIECPYLALLRAKSKGGNCFAEGPLVSNYSKHVQKRQWRNTFKGMIGKYKVGQIIDPIKPETYEGNGPVHPSYESVSYLRSNYGS